MHQIQTNKKISSHWILIQMFVALFLSVGTSCQESSIEVEVKSKKREGAETSTTQDSLAARLAELESQIASGKITGLAADHLVKQTADLKTLLKSKKKLSSSELIRWDDKLATLEGLATQSIASSSGTSTTSVASSTYKNDFGVDSAAYNLITTTGSASGADQRYAVSTSLYFAWSSAVDSGSGIRDYTVNYYTAAGCTGTGTAVKDLTTKSHSLTGTNGMIYSFKVTAFDNVGNSATSNCSGSILVDTTPPPALVTFTGATSVQPASINLTIDFPGTTDYASLVIRRVAGATAPADCTSGTAVKTYTTFTNNGLYRQRRHLWCCL
jgi:hypothetical protein